MTALTQGTRRKLSLLKLAEELQNVSKACKIMGYHRDTFYEVRRAFQVGGVEALVEQKRGPKGPHPARVSPEIEEAILAYSLEHPTRGQGRVANDLRLQGTEISPGGVRNVWLRHELETRYKRLMRLEQHAREDTFVLSEEQIQLLERGRGDPARPRSFPPVLQPGAQPPGLPAPRPDPRPGAPGGARSRRAAAPHPHPGGGVRPGRLAVTGGPGVG